MKVKYLVVQNAAYAKRLVKKLSKLLAGQAEVELWTVKRAGTFDESTIVVHAVDAGSEVLSLATSLSDRSMEAGLQVVLLLDRKDLEEDQTHEERDQFFRRMLGDYPRISWSYHDRTLGDDEMVQVAELIGCRPTNTALATNRFQLPWTVAKEEHEYLEVLQIRNALRWSVCDLQLAAHDEAELIVKAVNNHHPLVEHLSKCLSLMKGAGLAEANAEAAKSMSEVESLLANLDKSEGRQG